MKTSSGISYATTLTVYVSGKPVGEIREALTSTGRAGFRYWPKGSKSPGDWFATVAEVKRELEAV